MGQKKAEYVRTDTEPMIHTSESTPAPQGSSNKVILALVAVQVLFGTHYVVSKILVTAFPPLVWASLRSIITALLLVGFCLITKRQHPPWNGRYFGFLILLSFLGVILNQSFFLVGLSYTTSTNGAILSTLIPVFTLLLVTIRGQEALTLKRSLGFLSAFTGVLILVQVEEFTLSNKTIRGDLYILANCLSFAAFLTFGKKFLEKHDSLWNTAWLFVFGAIGLSLMTGSQWAMTHWPTITPKLVVCATFIIVGATLLTYSLNNYALARTRATSVALFVYIQPVLATALAYFWLNERFTQRTIVSCILVFVGIFLSTYQRGQSTFGTKKYTGN